MIYSTGFYPSFVSVERGDWPFLDSGLLRRAFFIINRG